MSSSKKRTSSHVSLTLPCVTWSVANSGEARSPVWLLKVSRRSARVNGPITCCDFGLDRVEKFPDADFCNPCKLWDERDISNKRNSCNSRRNACQRHHQSIFAPKEKEVQWWNTSGTITRPTCNELNPCPTEHIASSSCSYTSKKRINGWVSRSRRAYNEQKRFTDQLHDAIEMNEELRMKLDDARNRAEKSVLI